jgi:hypothetical protein
MVKNCKDVDSFFREELPRALGSSVTDGDKLFNFRWNKLQIKQWLMIHIDLGATVISKNKSASYVAMLLLHVITCV